MRGEKVIDFGFTFKYSDGGEFQEASEIVLRAPGLDKFDVHTSMKAWTGKAMLNFAQIARGETVSDEQIEQESPDNTTDDQDVMQMMSMGLNVDEFPKFAAYVRKVLTNSKKLATVGQTDIPLTDATWIDIENQGGMEAVFKIMSDFTGFFLGALTSKGQNGDGKSATLSSRTKAVSATKKRSVSRS